MTVDDLLHLSFGDGQHGQVVGVSPADKVHLVLPAKDVGEDAVGLTLLAAEVALVLGLQLGGGDRDRLGDELEPHGRVRALPQLLE